MLYLLPDGDIRPSPDDSCLTQRPTPFVCPTRG
eukprot:COSAG03_NODE_9696_length_700_cov_0.577371_2_plen_32_part_01